jgi:hypothetical protein
MYASFTNRGIHVFTSNNVGRKAYVGARNWRQCHSPARVPAIPVPDFGI